VTRVLALGGSIRSRPQNASLLEQLVREARTQQDILEALRRQKNKFTNTEICQAVALWGAKAEGAEVAYFNLKRLFPQADGPRGLAAENDPVLRDYLSVDPESEAALINELSRAQGLILGSPVYFGDRSSVANKFLQLLGGSAHLEGKVVGAVSAGAKRNGGQETTNVFLLDEARQAGAIVVGNGPSTSQYGGTVVAGDIGSALSDEWGLATCVGTGRRVAIAGGLAARESKLKKPLQVLALITMDDSHRSLSKRLRALLTSQSRVSVEVVELVDRRIERCIGCRICPVSNTLEQPENYGCIIEDSEDAMDVLHSKMKAADAILLAGMKSREKLTYRYQAFTERTRFIRRNNFELTNMPFASFTVEDALATADNRFHLRAMVSYLRHNALILPPIREIHAQGKTLVEGAVALSDFLDTAERIAANRSLATPHRVQYQAGGIGGYRPTPGDVTEAWRR
jgi:multimeric flavodoxin WrbA